MEKEDVFKAIDAYLKKDCNPYLSGSPGNLGGKNLKKEFKGFHSEAWRTGGIGGGSCWDEGDEDPHYELGEEESEPINTLEEFLKDFYPHLSLSQYKELMHHVRTEYWSEYEYYGNHTDYACHYITSDDIANFLVNLKKTQPIKLYR
jgi:hypothetical protein